MPGWTSSLFATATLALAVVSNASALTPDLLIAAYAAEGSTIQLAKKGRLATRAKPLSRSSQAHEIIWQRFNQLIPNSYRGLVSEFEIASDGPGKVTAYSGLSETRFGEWVLGVDPADVFPNGKLDRAELDASLIHEFGHILFQRQGQMDYSQEAHAAIFTGGYKREVTRARSSCQTFFTFDACARPDSFLYHYMYGYWRPMLQQWVDQSSSRLSRRQFLEAHKKGFVSSYAASHPVEDMIESFTAFVLRLQPTGNATLADSKINFFYQYPEMVRLRAHIRANL